MDTESLYARLTDISTTQAKHFERINYLETTVDNIRVEFSHTSTRLSDEIKKLTESIRESLTERQLEQINLNNTILNEIKSNSENLQRLVVEMTKREQAHAAAIEALATENAELKKRVATLEDFLKAINTTVTIIKWVGGAVGSSGLIAAAKYLLT